MSWDKLRIEGRLNFQFLKKSVRSVEGSKKIKFQTSISLTPSLLTCSVKLKRTGSSRPLGNLVPGSRNSSKNVCAHAWDWIFIIYLWQWYEKNLQGSNPCRWRVLQQPRHKVYCFRRGPSTEHLQDSRLDLSSQCWGRNHLWPGVGFDLRELKLCVVGVHLLDLLSGWGAQHLWVEDVNIFKVDRRAINTLMISTSWSTPLSPGKIGWKTGKSEYLRRTSNGVADIQAGLCPIHPSSPTWPNISSAKTQPALHTSMFVV